jgi:hypothetical protein
MNGNSLFVDTWCPLVHYWRKSGQTVSPTAKQGGMDAGINISFQGIALPF